MNKIILAALMLLSTSLFAQTWEQLNDAPVGRHHPISFAIDGKGYAITGLSSSEQPTDDTYQYDPIADTWTQLADFPGADRSFGIGAVSNGVAYLGFGATNTQYLRDFWSYDVTTGFFTQLADCGCSGRRHPAMIAIGDKIYVGLGDGAAGNLNDYWMYDIPTDSWTQIANLPGPVRHHPFMFNAGGEVFSGMGHGGNNIYNDWYKLDTAANTWSAMNDFPGEARVAGTQFDLNGYGFVLSGDGDNHSFMPTGEMWRYEPENDSWAQYPSHPGNSIWAPGSFVIDNDIFFYGGLDRSTNSYPLEVYKISDTSAVAPIDTMVVDTSTSIDDQVLRNTFVYPNPASGFVLWQNDLSVTEVKMYNTLGQLILTSAAEIQKMNTDKLDDGIYLVQFYANEKLIKTSKVLIQHHE